ncbi:hypothetical protein PspLS_05360 [Pyricularia sp. CBS 133598]|nr:hypothetical protein PspLS_08823 [Pyricularia sp. CBS 133598]TLD26890.1 hypothetical protein PspLS_05360 [Pyricularia sp. CBS 133598]
MSTRQHISVRRRGIRDVPAPRGPLSNFKIRTEAQLRSCIYHIDADYSAGYFNRPYIIRNALKEELSEDLKLKQEIPEKDAKEFALPFLALNSDRPLDVLASIVDSGYQNVNRRSPDNIPLLVYVAAKSPHLENRERDALFNRVMVSGGHPRCIPMELWRRPSLPMPLELSQDAGPMADWCTAERFTLLAPHLTVLMRDAYQTMLTDIYTRLFSHFSEHGPERNTPYCAMLAPTPSGTYEAMSICESFRGWGTFEVMLCRSNIYFSSSMARPIEGSLVLSRLNDFLVRNDAKTNIVRFDNLLGCDLQLDEFYNEIRKIISSVQYQDRNDPAKPPVDISKIIFLFTSSFANDLIAEHKDKWLFLREVKDWQQKSSHDENATPDRFMTLVEFSETPSGSACMDELVQAIQDKARSKPGIPAWALASQVCDSGSMIPYFPLEWEDMNLLAERKTQHDALEPCGQ